MDACPIIVFYCRECKQFIDVLPLGAKDFIEHKCELKETNNEGIR